MQAEESADSKHSTMFLEQPTLNRDCAARRARLDVARPCTLRGVFVCYHVQCITKTKSMQPSED